MKKLIAYPLTWGLFYLGVFISNVRLLDKGNFYNLYSWCMIKSSEIQDWGKLNSPWKDV